MTKDNSTGKNHDFYDLGKKMFDRIRVLPEHQAMIQRGVDRTTPPFKPDYNTEAVLVEEMQRMAKRIEELEALAQPEQEADAVAALTEEGWMWDGDQWQRPAQPEQEPVAYDKTEMNCFVQDLYDKKMQEGKHGHYETMFHVVHQAIKRVSSQRTWAGLTDEETAECFEAKVISDRLKADAKRIEAKLKEKNT